ncbi:unnamed protein product [Pseudo-nitzschia multistriata]|uniref:Uncharacterized protein n=1 Tax=Pseudo-nitzschia multistriata TaxID=183589 RepID=A0A448ZQM3_9STRA|nr:unnamed protein product [Pseudo-nitzschia multistriata]
MKLLEPGNPNLGMRKWSLRGKREENLLTSGACNHSDAPNSKNNCYYDSKEFKLAFPAAPPPLVPPQSTKTESINSKGYLPLSFESDSNTLALESAPEPDWSHRQQVSSGRIETEAKRCQRQPQSERVVLLYLIRHGEAEHNILEKKAMREACSSAIRDDGLPEDHPETKRRMEEARRRVLNDERLRDARLSELGRKEARDARANMKNMIDENGTVDANVGKQSLPLSLEQPSYVLVSPLTRALETADIVFPGHRSIHVREDLAERRTGKPPDTRSSCFTLGMRDSFKRFSLAQLQNQSMEKLKLEVAREQKQKGDVGKASSTSVTNTTICTGGSDANMAEKQEVFIMRGDLCEKIERDNFTEEDKEELRKRTERLFVLLGETDQSSIAVVTHKGYLRELERGPLGQTDATEFKNCEIRTYKVTVSLADHRLIEAERLR